MINIAMHLENFTNDKEAYEYAKEVIDSIVKQVVKIKEQKSVQFSIFSDERVQLENKDLNVSIMPSYYLYYYTGDVICFAEKQVTKLLKLVRTKNILLVPIFGSDFLELASRPQLEKENYVCLETNTIEYYRRIMNLELELSNKDNFLLKKYRI